MSLAKRLNGTSIHGRFAARNTWSRDSANGRLLVRGMGGKRSTDCLGKRVLLAALKEQDNRGGLVHFCLIPRKVDEADPDIKARIFEEEWRP